MANLNNLPTEILNAIITRLLHLYLAHSHPRNCLVDLSFVSRRLNHIVNTTLYQSVYYSNGGKGPPGPAEAFLSNPYIPPTRIFHLGYFYQTLSDSPHLRPLVLDVNMAWAKNAYDQVKEQAILNLTDLLDGCMRSLHLAPPYPSSALSFWRLTSLSLVYATTPNLFDANRVETLHHICTIPTLKHLSLSHWRLWTINSTAEDLQPRSSNITHLALYRSGLPGPSLAEVLTWPKGLESLIVQSYPYENLYAEEQTRYSPATILQYLQPQRETLQSLMLVINSNKWEANSTHLSDGTTLHDFSSIPHLKRLCVSRELLGFPERSGLPRPPFEIHMTLPPLIEEFHVDIQFSGNWDLLEVMNERLNEPLALGVFGSLECMQWIASQKAQCTPKLRRMVLYYGTYSRERRTMVEDRKVPFRGSERARCLSEEAAKVGIKVLAWTKWRRPLWGEWGAAASLS